jgi:Arc/MetJ-type ribon-helix-helix transcriptional regulator
MSTQTQSPPRDLSAENEAFIEHAIASGEFQSRTDVLNMSMDLLRRQALLDLIDEGRRQLDEGEYTDYDQDGLRRRFEELKERVRRRIRESRLE